MPTMEPVTTIKFPVRVDKRRTGYHPENYLRKKRGPNAAQQRAKERKINATGRQKMAAQLRHENPTESDKNILLQAGYDESTATVPSLVTNSVGYKHELAKYGLTEELITSSLVEDIQAKPQRRVRELELGADILNMRKRQSIFGDVHFSLVGLAQEWEKAQLEAPKEIEKPEITG